MSDTAICFVCTTNPAMPDDFGPGYPEALIEAEKGRCESCAMFALENVGQMLCAENARLRAALESLKGEDCGTPDMLAAIDKALRGEA